ncbi:hypothetical protein RRSWK_07176 [Rhodopirellula sp. SWK7]|nr:hypothetical protein RRSWK_07176 [Rhodopirellula sp. SWK7]
MSESLGQLFCLIVSTDFSLTANLLNVLISAQEPLTLQGLRRSLAPEHARLVD